MPEWCCSLTGCAGAELKFSFGRLLFKIRCLFLACFFFSFPPPLFGHLHVSLYFFPLICQETGLGGVPGQPGSARLLPSPVSSRAPTAAQHPWKCETGSQGDDFSCWMLRSPAWDWIGKCEWFGVFLCFLRAASPSQSCQKAAQKQAVQTLALTGEEGGAGVPLTPARHCLSAPWKKT